MFRQVGSAVIGSQGDVVLRMPRLFPGQSLWWASLPGGGLSGAVDHHPHRILEGRHCGVKQLYEVPVLRVPGLRVVAAARKSGDWDPLGPEPNDLFLEVAVQVVGHGDGDGAGVPGVPLHVVGDLVKHGVVGA